MAEYLTLKPVSDDAEILFETDLKNLYELFALGEDLETITLAREIDGKIYERTFDMLWYNQYDSNFGKYTFCVLGAREDEGYFKYVYRVVEFEDDTTGLYFEEDEDVLEVIRADFDAALNAYKSNNVVSAPAGNTPSKNKGVALKAVRAGKSDKSIFAVLTVLYGLVLGAGLIGYFTGFGIEDNANNILCKAVCIVYVLMAPSYIVYLGAHNPFNAHKALAVTAMVIGCLAMAAGAFFGLMFVSHLNDLAEFTGFWAFFMNVFLLILPFITVVIYALAYIWLCRVLAPGWFLGLGIPITLLFPVAGALIFAIFGIMFVIMAIKWILSSLGIIAADTGFGRGFMSGLTGKRIEGQYTVTDENGYTHTLHSDNGRDFYESDGRYYGSSDDGGKTVRRG